ncbi:MAG: hypothetical protein EAZ76_07660 [Nostocales cyanobacterium]|nr:MAG: hypothetical protein EAZ87_21435 [Nostocales cyanobacterium]TAF16322.1 MAG: hypothetical protein EAZ76_07660 [Nostocales cyanobacterium]
MRLLPSGKELNFSVIFAIKCTSLTFFFGTLIFCGFYIGSFMISYVTSNSNTTTPTFMDGIKDANKFMDRK